MRFLLDTHTFLWLTMGDKRLSDTTQEILLSDENELFFSMASFWEMAIKSSFGKLKLADGWTSIANAELSTNAIQRLPISDVHCEKVSTLPFHHRDPFDRMLIAQAITENISILSKDKIFSEYGIECIW